MENKLLIDIDNEGTISISGNTNPITANRRIEFSLKRLGYRVIDLVIKIPSQPNAELPTLSFLARLLDGAGYHFEYSARIKELYQDYEREVVMFQTFSDRARNIRDDKFRENPDLVHFFDEFQGFLSKNLKRKLYKLQLLSAFHMTFAQNACNFAVPGAGKTTIVYAAYSYLRSLPNNDERHVDKLLVIAPISAFKPWEDEHEECFGIKADAKRIYGEVEPEERRGHFYSGRPAEITLISHGGVVNVKDAIVDFLKANKTMVVVDEAHRIKNVEGVWSSNILDISKYAKSRVVLTGTPVPNGYQDLFNLIRFIYPYKYEEIIKFHYANLVDLTKNAETNDMRVKQLASNIAPFFIRIKKKDLNLPPTEEQLVQITLDQTHQKIYDFVFEKYLPLFKKDPSAKIKDVLNKARLIRLRQAATDPSLLLKSLNETIDPLDEGYGLIETENPLDAIFDSDIIKEIKKFEFDLVPRKHQECLSIVDRLVRSESKVIIWTIFIHNAKRLQRLLREKNIHSALLIGEIEQEEREKIITDFNHNNSSNLKVVIANPFSVAESISLHKGCHNAIYFERDYNCGNFIQSKDRIHRVGLSPDQVTSYYYLASANTIDLVINNKLEEKMERMSKIIDSEIPLFGRLDEDDETDLISSLIKQYAARFD